MPRQRLSILALALLLAPAAARAQEPATPAPAPEPMSRHMMAMHGESSGAPGGHMAGLPQPAPADVATPEATVAAYYAALSGPAAQKRDWNRFLSLFFPGARLLPAEGKGHTGTMPHQFSPSKYLYDTESNMLEEGYLAKETDHRSEGFGKILHVWSTYEVRHAAGDAKPFVRGINSFELFFDGKRWWIFSVLWQPETTKLALTEEKLSP